MDTLDHETSRLDKHSGLFGAVAPCHTVLHGDEAFSGLVAERAPLANRSGGGSFCSAVLFVVDRPDHADYISPLRHPPPALKVNMKVEWPTTV